MSRIPAGCKCAEDWNATRRIPSVCRRFSRGSGLDCGDCRHDAACHRRTMDTVRAEERARARDLTLTDAEVDKRISDRWHEAVARIRRAGEDLERAVRAK